MKELNSTLRVLGLSEGEIKTYLQALELGPSTVLDLSKSTKLSRQATYDAIEALTKRGLMTNAEQTKKKLFAAEDPERLADYARRREQEIKGYIAELERAVPELKLRTGGERPSVRVFEGKEGVLAIVEDMQRSHPKNSVEISDLDAMYMILMPEDLLPMRNLMKKFHVQSKSLLTKASTSRIVDADRRLLPENMRGFRSNITVYEDKIALVTFVGKMQSVIIESKPLAQAFRILFDLAFETAKKFPPA